MKLPWSIDWAQRVSPESLRHDLVAGLTGATIVLPQGVAFAAIAGLPPAYGFYSAIVPTIIAALTGSSWHSVSGPNTAISLLVFGALSAVFAVGSEPYIQAAITLALLVGVIQLGFSLARMGALVDFVSHSVMVGFISAAAILIVVSQIPPALGLTIERSASLSRTVLEILSAFGQTDFKSASVAATTLVAAVGVRWFWPKSPNYLVALGVGTLVYLLLGSHGGGLRTVGAVPQVLPQAAFPDVDVARLQSLAPAALAIAIVGLLQAASIARALAMRSGQPYDNNREFLGQGLSNAVGSLFQSYPASASFTRSGVNYEAGARTPLAAVFASLFLVAILIVVAPLFAYVPLPAIAGIIILVALRLLEPFVIWQILRTSRSETAITAVTFLSALLINLEFSILIGVLLSLALFLKKTAHPRIGIGAPDARSSRRIFRNAEENELPECPQLVISRINGPLYFGSVEFIRREFRRIALERPSQKHMLFIVKGVGEIDMPGAELLVEEAENRAARGGAFHLQTRTPRQLEKVARLHVLRRLTRSNIHLSKGEAIAEIVPGLDPEKCRNCGVRVFMECRRRPGGEGA